MTEEPSLVFVSLKSLETPKEIPSHYGMELRLDLIHNSLTEVASFIQTSKHPILLTLRSVSHGGKCALSAKEREDFLEKMIQLNPSFCDLECDLDPLFLKKTIQNHPQIKFILSYHNTQETPPDLETMYQNMALYPAYHYKIAAQPQSLSDVLRMLEIASKHPKLSTISMGEKGSFSRIFSAFSKGKIQFACVNDENAVSTGQIAYQDLHHLYRYSDLSSNTSIFALIGDPVSKSQGHIYHNRLFIQKNQDAVYLKIPLQEEELPLFFDFVKKMPFKGISVTMPLKEKIAPFLDNIDPECLKTQAINTIVVQDQKLIGKNTDGQGALQAIQQKGSIEGKKMIILGAGGSSKAIALSLIKAGGIVTILNRTKEKAIKTALSLGCQAGSLNDIPNDYDILINCTSDELPIDPSKIIPGSIVMDITYVPKETKILKEALQKNCKIIYGEEMFFNQANLQRLLWSV